MIYKISVKVLSYPGKGEQGQLDFVKGAPKKGVSKTITTVVTTSRSTNEPSGIGHPDNDPTELK